MIKETLLLGSICCFATMSFAVARFGDVPAPTGMEWEQEQNLSLNKEPARAWAFSFTDARQRNTITVIRIVMTRPLSTTAPLVRAGLRKSGKIKYRNTNP